MKTKNLFRLGAAVLAVAWTQGLAEDPYAVGEKWVYQHKGPRAMSQDLQPIRGDRVIEVTSVKGEGENRRWQVKHVWGEDDDTPALIQFDADKKMHEIALGSMLDIEFQPPTPSEWDVAPGDKTKFETKVLVMGLEVPIRYEVECLPKETLETPAGKFKDCQHVRVIVHSMDQTGQPTKTRHDQWLHAEANGLVKEIFVYNYQAEGSYMGTSVLKTHTKH